MSLVASVIVVGAFAELLAWRIVVVGRRSVWAVMGPALGLIGLVALLARRPGLSAAVAPWAAVVAGIGSGLALYVATRAFVVLVRGWHWFRRHAEELYLERRHLPLGLAVALAVGVMVVGEELFWRGLVQTRLSESVGRASGGAIGWAAYVAANLGSANLAIVAGAVVGGAVWAGLAVWTRGVLASILCHGLWTSLMLAFPVIGRTRSPASHGS